MISNSVNYLNQPNLLLMVYKSKKIEANEIRKPNIINGLDLLLFSGSGLFLERDKVLSFFLKRRLGKGLITIR